MLRRADPTFLSLALIAETLRYIISASTTHVLARLFKRIVPLEPLTEAFFAGAAANRTFSTGGAPGMVVRLLFLMRQGVDAGSVAVIYLIEDIAGLFIGSLLFIIGIVGIVNAHPSNSFIINFTAALAVGSILCALGALYVYRRRGWVEKSVHALARAFNSIMNWFLGRPLYTTERVQQVLEPAAYRSLTGSTLDPARCHIMLCGNPLMIESTAAMLCQQGFCVHEPGQPGNIHFERYW